MPSTWQRKTEPGKVINNLMETRRDVEIHKMLAGCWLSLQLPIELNFLNPPNHIIIFQMLKIKSREPAGDFQNDDTDPTFYFVYCSMPSWLVVVEYCSKCYANIHCIHTISFHSKIGSFCILHGHRWLFIYLLVFKTSIVPCTPSIPFGHVAVLWNK